MYESTFVHCTYDVYNVDRQDTVTARSRMFAPPAHSQQRSECRREEKNPSVPLEMRPQSFSTRPRRTPRAGASLSLLEREFAQHAGRPHVIRRHHRSETEDRSTLSPSSLVSHRSGRVVDLVRLFKAPSARSAPPGPRTRSREASPPVSGAAGRTFSSPSFLFPSSCTRGTKTSSSSRRGESSFTRAGSCTAPS